MTFMSVSHGAREIVTALVNAYRRGVDVRVIVDRRQLEDDHSDRIAVMRLAVAGVPVLVDRIAGLMHDKVTIIDQAVVVTGSFNYTWSAEHKNVENLLVVHDRVLAAQYLSDWTARASRADVLKKGAWTTKPLSAD